MKRAVLAVLLVMIVAIPALVYRHSIVGITLANRDAWMSSRRLSTALKGARAVTLIEYVPGKLIARKTATPDEITRLQSAASKSFRPFRPDIFGCWEPHHSLDIVRADGSDVIVEICFLCGKFGFLSDDESVVPLPPSLTKSLTLFFTSVGMRPKTYEEYLAMEPSTNDVQAEEAKNKLR